MGFDPGQLIALFEERLGRRWTTILAWLLFLVVIGWAVRFLVIDVLMPIEIFFGGTGDLRADLFGGDLAPFWPAVTLLIVFLAASVLLFLPFINLLVRGRRVPMFVLDTLEDLRSKAIHEILNLPVKSDIDLDSLKQRGDKFVADVTNVLSGHFSKIEVKRFNRLGFVPSFSFAPAYNGEHLHRIQMLAKRLDALERIIDRHMAV